MIAILAENLTIDTDAIAAFCQRNHIRWMAIFGSALRDDFGPESDVDVLVEFEEGKTPGYRFITMQDELSTLLHRRVDLLTRDPQPMGKGKSALRGPGSL